VEKFFQVFRRWALGTTAPSSHPWLRHWKVATWCWKYVYYTLRSWFLMMDWEQLTLLHPRRE